MNPIATALSVIIIILPGPGGSDQASPPIGTAPPASAAQAGDSGARPLLGLGVGGGDVAAVDLAGWKLAIPETNDKGTAASVAPTDAGAEPWMTKGQDGAVHMWAPVAGATTPNSNHARTELQSLTYFKAATGRHQLSASVTVSQVPKARPDVIIGQIHGAGDISSVSWVMLHYDAGDIRVVVKQAQSGPRSDKYPLIAGVPLGARFDYTLSDNGDGNIISTATYGATTKTATIPISVAFKGATVRFQAGDYQQADSKAAGGGGSAGASDSEDGEDGARVTFHTLVARHDGATEAANG